MKLAYPDPSLCCTELLMEPTVTRQYIIEREPDWFNIYLKIDVSDVTRKPFPVTSEIYVFLQIFGKCMKGTACLCISDVY